MAGWGKRRPDEVERTCRECGQTKPLREFASTGAYGRRTVCRICWNVSRRVATQSPEEVERTRLYNRERYRANAQKVIRQARERRHKRNPPPVAPRRWLSSVRAAIELGRSEQWVRVRCQQGVFNAIKIPNRPRGGLVWMIDPASLAEVKREVDKHGDTR